MNTDKVVAEGDRTNETKATITDIVEENVPECDLERFMNLLTIPLYDLFL